MEKEFEYTEGDSTIYGTVKLLKDYRKENYEYNNPILHETISSVRNVSKIIVSIGMTVIREYDKLYSEEEIWNKLKEAETLLERELKSRIKVKDKLTFIEKLKNKGYE